MKSEEPKNNKKEIAALLRNAIEAIGKGTNYDKHVSMLLPTAVTHRLSYTWLFDSLAHAAMLEVKLVVDHKDDIFLVIRKANNSLIGPAFAMAAIGKLLEAVES